MVNKATPKRGRAPRKQNESRRNFQDEQRARAWADLSHPNGDPYRQSIINPIVYGLIEDLTIWEQSRKSEPLDYSDDDSPLSDALAKYYARVCPNGKTLGQDTEELGWVVDINSHTYLDWFKTEPKDGLSRGQRFHILDLGCGEGYRGRWLGQKRFSYTGVDYSKTLIEIARDRLKTTQLPKDVNVLFEEIDLRNDPTQVSEGLLKPETRIVLAITILDHLNDDDAVHLLQSLCANAGATKRCYVLVATCNPDYYKKLEYDNDAPVEGHCKRAIGKLESLIKNEACDVEFFPRSTAQYQRLFRDAGLLIIDQVTPIAPITLRHDSEDIYEKGTGPFHVWLLSLHGRAFGKAGLASQVFSHIEPSSVAGKLIAKLQESNVSEVKTMTVVAGRPIVGMNNAGGNLFILLRGEAFLRAHSPRIPKMPFRAGTVFGDLELADFAGPVHDNQLRATSYRQSVIAAKESTLAVIAESDVQSFVTNSSIEGELHKLLRIRLQSQLWLMDAKSANFKVNASSLRRLNVLKFSPAVEAGKIFSIHIQGCHFVSACLVAALERQRSAFPDLGLGNNILFIPDINGNVQSVGEIAQVSHAVRMLVNAGIIYSAPLTATRTLWDEINSMNSSDPLRKIAANQEISKRYSRFVNPDSGFKNQTSFFLIEDEWALRKIAARPGDGMTRLIDNFLFLNGTYNTAEDRLKYIPTYDAYGNSSAETLMKYSPVYSARFRRLLICVQDYLRGVITKDIAEDSLGFSLGAGGQ